MQIQRSNKGLNGLPTFGVMTSRDGQFTCVTLERPADDPVHPCVPAAKYVVDKVTHHPDTPGAYPCPGLRDVPHRSNIEIHILNTVAESLGCIGPGEDIADDRLSIEHSGDAFKRMMAHIGDNFPFELEILDPQ